MLNLVQAILNSGCPAFTMKYKPDFPINFLCENNLFSDSDTVLLSDIIHPDDYQPFCEMVGEVIGNRCKYIKSHVRLKTGEKYLWYYISAAPQMSEDGSVRELSGMMFDVTEYFGCEGDDAVMRKFRSRVEDSMKSTVNVPRLLDILGYDYLERIQQPFTHIKGLYSIITDSTGKTIATAYGQDKGINVNKISYQRKKSIRIKHVTAGYWVIAGESIDDMNKATPMLETMVQTVSEIANSYVVICEEMENSQKANKLLGQNFEDQILVNNLYSLILKSKDTNASFSSIIPLIKEYFDLDDIVFIADATKPVKLYHWNAEGEISPVVTENIRFDIIDKDLESNAVLCISEDELKGAPSKNRSCALSRVYENGTTKGILLFVAHNSGREWPNRDRKVLKNITQILSTVIYRSFMETELAASQEHLQRLAYYNTTTGIPNRSAFERDFNKVVSDSRYGAVISVEIANLKTLSELYNTQYSDEIVRSVAEYIAAIPTQSEKMIYRFSSEVLTVMIPEATRELAMQFAQTILMKFRSPWYLNDNENRLNIYAGICIFPDNADNVADCIRSSALTLRLAQERGLYEPLCYSEGLEEKLGDNKRVKELIIESAENDFKGFYFLYTPVVDASTGKLECCEAHLFWSNGSIIVPKERFLPIIERISLSTEIYSFVVDRVCEFCAAVRESGLEDFRVGFSIPADMLTIDKGVAILQKALLEYSLPPDSISISVSESEGTLGTSTALKQFHATGLNIIADDKGGNFFTAAPLENPCVNMIKLRSRRLSDDPISAAFVRSLIERAHSKGIKVCVKGVDNFAALENARRFNADLVQGIINGRPLHTSEFIEKLVMAKGSGAGREVH